MTVKINLKNKNVLITGGDGGIGSEIVLKFLNAGANCICLDKSFQNIERKIQKKFISKIIFLEINFERKGFEKKILKKIKKVDILINSAGISLSRNFINYRLKDWEKTIKINLTTPFIVSQIVAKKFMKSGGCIINITSLAAEQGFPNNVAYVASKAGLKQLSKGMAIDLAKQNIRVNSVGPGYVRTKMTEKSWNNKIKRKKRSERIIMDRWADPKDIANACLFLGSNLASYINGQDIYIDGGWLSKGLSDER